MENLTNKIASTHLGKKSQGSKIYDPSLLVCVPRLENRKQYNINPENLPFTGFDVWHTYEFSALTKNNLPVTRLMKLKYKCENEFLIESKSLKLYLNSFNMTPFGKSTQDCLEICKQTIEKDLSQKLQTPVEVNFLPYNTKTQAIFKDYTNITEFIDEKNLKIENFKEAPEVLKTENLNQTSQYRLRFESLRSNCRVTHQPDFGQAFIYYKSKKHIPEESLIKYLASFRAEFHFHEECCEMIYKRLFDLLNAEDELMVCTLYTRRGGIDICPVRFSKNISIEDFNKLIDLNAYATFGNMQ